LPNCSLSRNSKLLKTQYYSSYPDSGDQTCWEAELEMQALLLYGEGRAAVRHVYGQAEALSGKENAWEKGWNVDFDTRYAGWIQ